MDDPLSIFAQAEESDRAKARAKMSTPNKTKTFGGMMSNIFNEASAFAAGTSGNSGTSASTSSGSSPRGGAVSSAPVAHTWPATAGVPAKRNIFQDEDPAEAAIRLRRQQQQRTSPPKPPPQQQQQQQQQQRQAPSQSTGTAGCPDATDGLSQSRSSEATTRPEAVPEDLRPQPPLASPAPAPASAGTGTGTGTAMYNSLFLSLSSLFLPLTLTPLSPCT
jgi:hypothetical protein